LPFFFSFENLNRFPSKFLVSRLSVCRLLLLSLFHHHRRRRRRRRRAWILFCDQFSLSLSNSLQCLCQLPTTAINSHQLPTANDFFQVKFPGRMTSECWVVMPNLFKLYPTTGIDLKEMYDLKGSTYQRYQQPSPPVLVTTTTPSMMTTAAVGNNNNTTTPAAATAAAAATAPAAPAATAAAATAAAVAAAVVAAVAASSSWLHSPVSSPRAWRLAPQVMESPLIR
jgi:hypothetical protein